MELTVLGCSGSYGAPGGGACSGYLLRTASTSVWVDCGNGTFSHLQEHLKVEELTAVVLTHGHPDHCVDIYGLHVLLGESISAVFMAVDISAITCRPCVTRLFLKSHILVLALGRPDGNDILS